MKLVFLLLALGAIEAIAKPRAQFGLLGGANDGGGDKFAELPLQANLSVGGSGNRGYRWFNPCKYLTWIGWVFAWPCKRSANCENLNDGAELSAPEGNAASTGYTYNISVTAKKLFTTQNKPAVRFASLYWLGNVTYTKVVNDEHPLTAQVNISNNAGPKYITRRRHNETNACGDPDDGTWEYVAVKVIQQSFMPEGHCPVEPGTYITEREPSPVTVTFPEMIDCGQYKFAASILRDDQWNLAVPFVLNVEDNGDCIPGNSMPDEDL